METTRTFSADAWLTELRRWLRKEAFSGLRLQLLLTVCLLCGAAFIGAWHGRVPLPQDPTDVSIDRPDRLAALPQTNVGKDDFLHLGQQANGYVKYLVLPLDTPLAEAVGRFERGEGQPLQLSAVNERSTERQRKSLFLFYNHRDSDLVLQYDSTAVERIAVWTGVLTAGQPGALRLVNRAGTDVGIGERRRAQPYFVPLGTRPRFFLPDTQGRTASVLVRLDFSEPFYSHFYADRPASTLSWHMPEIWLGAVIFGAGCVSIVLAAVAAIRRRSPDYLIFVAAVGAMVYWYLLRCEITPGFDATLSRRASVWIPMYLYFFLNCIGTHRLLARKSDMPGMALPPIAISPLQRGALGIAFAINIAALAINVCYAFGGMRAPGATYLPDIARLVPTVIPGLLLTAIVSAAWRKQPGARALLCAQSVALIGFGAMDLAALLPPLTALDVVLTYVTSFAVPLEALVWALAIRQHYQALDMIAQRLIDEALDRRETSVRQELREIYGALHDANTMLIHIREVDGHATRNILSRLRKRNRMLREQLGEQQLTAEITELLRQIETQLDQSSEQSRSVLTRSSLRLPLGDAIQRVLDSAKTELALRQLSVEVHVDDDVRSAMTSAYQTNVIIQELIENACRYADASEPVIISARRDRGFVALTVSNRIGESIAVDFDSLNHGTAVTPSRVTLNGDKSNGIGLANLSAILEVSGQRISYVRQGDCRFSASVRLSIGAPEPQRPQAPVAV